MTAQTTTQRTAKHRLAVKERMAAMQHALELALPWLSPPLDDRDTSASGMAYKAVSEALGRTTTAKAP